MTDTRHLRSDDFTTIIGAELSSAGWRERNVYWLVAAGLPLDFEPPPADDHASAIARARDAGAFVVLLHPGLNNLSVSAVDELPAFDAVEAVEIYNHSLTTGPQIDRASGRYMLDGLLERGRRAHASIASSYAAMSLRFAPAPPTASPSAVAALAGSTPRSNKRKPAGGSPGLPSTCRLSAARTAA